MIRITDAPAPAHPPPSLPTSCISASPRVTRQRRDGDACAIFAGRLLLQWAPDGHAPAAADATSPYRTNACPPRARLLRRRRQMRQVRRTDGRTGAAGFIFGQRCEGGRGNEGSEGEWRFSIVNQCCSGHRRESCHKIRDRRPTHSTAIIMRVVHVLGTLLALAVCLAPNTEAQFFRGFRHGFLGKVSPRLSSPPLRSVA